jgi:uncharacterized protein
MMLTAPFVLLFGMTFLQAVATTKVINVFSSGSCGTSVYLVWCRGFEAWYRSWSLHVSGCAAGRPHALFLSTVWLRRIVIAAVLGLAIKLLLPLH